MNLAELNELRTMLYTLRGAMCEESEPVQQMVKESEEKAREFIARLEADYPDKNGLMGGMIAVLDYLVKNGL
ncbi:hypothetical protein JZN10_004335 [Salmonella enterica]|uniref:Uncharacterized protein n=1 Tax=Salmonella enterica I TaxID=59201 RepID=A0A403MN45_SALET|nr:hypothetical protein [Salmonella enterica subsp. enterica serovar Oranienburg]ECD4943429.1 hypothetical protein [Salmonella enterica subsp. enterica serovar Muenchen]EHB1587211.1 hypothetical protein [Salmonella enterica]ECJ7956142.1 hypothetical protein [Salmonella enterica subsp. enterica serovar Muenchen]EED9397185.1 hypothetical protein [Salmonella enterica subsp. enterica serovar Oranienburg]